MMKTVDDGRFEKIDKALAMVKKVAGVRNATIICTSEEDKKMLLELAANQNYLINEPKVVDPRGYVMIDISRWVDKSMYFFNLSDVPYVKIVNFAGSKEESLRDKIFENADKPCIRDAMFEALAMEDCDDDRVDDMTDIIVNMPEEDRRALVQIILNNLPTRTALNAVSGYLDILAMKQEKKETSGRYPWED